MDGHILEKKTCIQFLDLYIDEKLCWDVHINQLSIKLSKTNAMIKLASQFLPKSSLLSMYYAFFLFSLII